MIITFYNEKINPIIVESQRKVFEHFGLTIHQIKPDVWRGHGGSIDHFIQNHKKRWDYILLLDIDCIPLDKDIVPETIEWIMNNDGLFSVAQKASHIPNSIVYASPAYLGFSRKTYDLLGRPTFGCTDRSDCAGELTYISHEKDLEVKLLYPTEVEIPRWDLDGNIKFGTGTNYENRVYHYFESRKNRQQNFIDKCKTIIES